VPNDLDLSNHPPLTESQRAVLTSLLDTLVPASEDGEMPSAAEVGFEVYLQTQARDFVPELLDVLQQLGPTFAELSPGARHEQVSEFSSGDPTKFGSLLARVYDCYYQNDQVRERIGVVRGAVFPQGNEVTQGDLSLLDPVIGNSERYRYRTP
jgi:hypothetical protein